MTKRGISIFVLLLLSPTLFAADLPDTVIAALKRARIPLSNVAVEVRELNQPALISVNAQQSMNPASTMKLLTTLSGLEILGPAYRWKTEAYLDGKLENGVLQGNLVFKGYGNPKLTIEQFWLWLHELRARGLREIRGDVVLDQSFFANLKDDPAEFDDDPSRAYNVTPNALLINFNALRLRLIPSTGVAWLEPNLANYTLVNNIRFTHQPTCPQKSNYQARLDGHNIVLEGKLSSNCDESEKYFSLLSHDDYFYAIFQTLWQEVGGTLHGKLRLGTAPANQPVFATHFSPPLSEAIRDINKFSNNTMARQLFLSLSTSTPASIESSTAAIQQWLASQHLSFPELVLENGAGLSRKERISAQHLADLLQYNATSPISAELVASLPILGIDGTMKKRFQDRDGRGHAHLKTGSLTGVKSIAGYVSGKNGKQWIVVFIVNHSRSAYSAAAQDALVEWLEQGGE
ncbi:MAG: D-alanyl-D-alanine carboxypeptidase/D-alanyl-D-alanine-endopeptidase [Gallionella sp.]|nr:D-alanyl-D-alanine carboxypeptidase/D-alanyl-D-alanine-endopeptidase [Gallionella sp.]MDD4959252.1 D-alanyl-D-alanine carboxypeptidase/D-alanyl-D-alanine-endopeptidase [Gallionella sp.]